MTNTLPDMSSDKNNSQSNEYIDQYDRRFSGTANLYSDVIFTAFENAHVYVIGVGGVGTWVAEGLARTAIGQITLIDMDVLVASNVNRQLPALDDNFGISKIDAMGKRLKQINPRLTLNLVDDFLTVDNVAQLLPSLNQNKTDKSNGQLNIILDCTDDMPAKIAIALHCHFNKLKIICAGGAGGKTDPSRITVSDLKESYQDPLLARLRLKLRHENGINKKMKEKFGIRCVYSTQPPIVKRKNDDSCQTGGGLRCGGYGSSVVITSVVGMVMVAETLSLLTAMVAK